MSRLAVFVAASTLACSLTARADVPLWLGVDAGVETDTEAWRSAPALALQAGAWLGHRLALSGRVDGWTLPGAGSAVANSEISASLDLSYTQPLTRILSFCATAGPAAVFQTHIGGPLQTSPGVFLNPALVFATRRKTLALQIGAQALAFTEGFRLGATAGVVYTFR
jgi:hypothetical protein